MSNPKNTSPKFPTVKGSNLQRKTMTLPNDLEGDLNLLFVPFQRWQQSQVDSWIPFAITLENDYPNLRYYELPTMQSLNWLSQTFINQGMRAGIPDPMARERTITLYLNKNEFKDALGIETETTIHVFLVNRDGDVLWRSEGNYSREEAQALSSVIKKKLEK